MIYDYLIIGAGISGAAAAYELSKQGSVIVIEAENIPGYHSTGRSAALYTPNYGDPIVRQVNRASKQFLNNPPLGFCHTPLLTQRGQLTVALPGEDEKLSEILAQSVPEDPIERISAAQACDIAPLLDPAFVESATLEPGVADIEVASLHQGYLAAIKRQGGQVICSMHVEAITRKDNVWHVSSKKQTLIGKTLINAAGAWADQVAIMAQATPIGLVAKRRTAIIVDLPTVTRSKAPLPAIDFTDCNGYLKPEAGKLMVSPGDETPVEPQDAWPEDWDIAVLVDWLETRTRIDVQRVDHSWAGLRTFAADNLPVVGYDPVIEDFFWLGGQGGYGIMMAPALGCATAALINHGALSTELLSTGMLADQISPCRFVK